MWKEPVLKFQEFHLNQFSPESKEYCCHTLLKNLSFFFFSHNLIAKIFLINWTWISHFTKDNKDTNHTNGIHIHTPEGRTVTILQDDRYGVPNKHFPNTNGPRSQTHNRTNWQKYPNSTLCSQTVLNVRHTSEPIGKNAQMTLSAHKQSSMAERHWNLLAKCPNSTLCLPMVLNIRHTTEPIGKMPNNMSCSKEKFAQVHTGGLTQSWSLSALPDACFCSTKEKYKLAASAEQGRNREDPQNKWFWQLLGMSPQIPP